MIVSFYSAMIVYFLASYAGLLSIYPLPANLHFFLVNYAGLLLALPSSAQTPASAGQLGRARSRLAYLTRKKDRLADKG